MIGELGAQHYPECLRVLRASFATVTTEFGISAANTPSNPAFWEAETVGAVVAKGFTLIGLLDEDRSLAGCAFVGPAREAGSWQLRHLGVPPERRHRGYGEALVLEAARRAGMAGATRLKISIVGENTQLAQWYHRLGFVTVESGKQYPGLVFSVDHLELEIAQH